MAQCLQTVLKLPFHLLEDVICMSRKDMFFDYHLENFRKPANTLVV